MADELVKKMRGENLWQFPMTNGEIYVELIVDRVTGTPYIRMRTHSRGRKLVVTVDDNGSIRVTIAAP